MFAPVYFPPRYFASRYFSDGGEGYPGDNILLSIYIERVHTSQIYVERSNLNAILYIERALQLPTEL